MSSFSIKGMSQLNLSLNIDNKKNIENIQIIINDLKELIDILSFKISDVKITTQEQISQNEQEVEQVGQEVEQVGQELEQVEKQVDTFVNDGSNIPDFSGGNVEVETNAVIGFFD